MAGCGREINMVPNQSHSYIRFSLLSRRNEHFLSGLSGNISTRLKREFNIAMLFACAVILVDRSQLVRDPQAHCPPLTIYPSRRNSFDIFKNTSHLPLYYNSFKLRILTSNIMTGHMNSLTVIRPVLSDNPCSKRGKNVFKSNDLTTINLLCYSVMAQHMKDNLIKLIFFIRKVSKESFGCQKYK